MELTRRDAMALGAGTLAATAISAVPAFASTAETEIAGFTGGADMVEGGVTLTAPEIAENGNTVPISVAAPDAVEMAVFATENPVPKVLTVSFGPLNTSHSLSTRIRLAGTQEVVAVAQMADGSFHRASAIVKVTIGGCGG